LIREQWLKEIISFAVLTGMRRGEILNLQWQDVDIDRKLVFIQSSPTFRVKCGKKRVIPLNTIAVRLLETKTGKEKSEYVFALNGKKLSEHHVSHRFKYYVDEAKLSDKLHFHSLRHTFASWLVQDGVPLFEIQKLLGHSDISTTQVYAHLLPENLHSTVNRLNNSI
jgi:integrase